MLRWARQKAQGKVVDAGRSGRLCDRKTQDQNRRGIIRRKNISVAQYKCGGWRGGWDAMGEG